MTKVIVKPSLLYLPTPSTGKLYTKPTTTNHPLHTNRFLCASGTPQSKTITFGVKIDNHPRIDIIL